MDFEERVVEELLKVITICKHDLQMPELILLGEIKTKSKVVQGVCLLYINPSRTKTYDLKHGLNKTVAYKPSIPDRYFVNCGSQLVKLSELSTLLLQVELAF